MRTIKRSCGAHVLQGNGSLHACCRHLSIRCAGVERCTGTGRYVSGVLTRGVSSLAYRTYRLGFVLSCCLRAKRFRRTCGHTRPLVAERISYCRTGLETCVGLTCCTYGTKGPRVTTSVYTQTRRTLIKERGSRCLLLCLKLFVTCCFVARPSQN